MCVNQGRGTAVKILQRACNAKGADLAIDGGMGPGTMKRNRNLQTFHR